ncbi:MAG: dipeptide epimerase [Bacteroidia bacterium]|nr:dipeptide epimerase [Bacteroidia bacterium]
MKITNVTYERYDLELTEPYTIAYETISKATNFVLRIETDQNIIGFGCAAPDLAVTGETAEDVERSLNNEIAQQLKNADPFHYARILDELKLSQSVGASARAMCDAALFDLIAKKADVPLYKFLGGYKEEIPTSITIGIMDIDQTIKKASKFVEDGFYILKIKGGLNLDEDVTKLELIRKKFPKIVLRFDGNQGYSLEDSMNFARKTEDIGIQIFEQPTSTEEEHLLAKLSQNISIPVMADESLKTLGDIHRLAKNNSSDMINIKLMKIGGIQEGMHINSVAKAAKNEVMVGCLDECSLGISMGLHFALSRPNIEFADLDSHLDFNLDPFKGLFTLKSGVLRPNSLPGLGLK